MEEKPLVSVIIPTYNRFEFVQKAINSVLKQDIHDKVEILVINDASTDVKYSTLRQLYQDHSNVHVIDRSINSRAVAGANSQGLVKNDGLLTSKGEWIAFLDDDDQYLNTDKLSYQINLMMRYGCQLSSTNMNTDSTIGNWLTPYFLDFYHGMQLEPKIYLLTLTDITRSNLINNSTCVIHNSIANKVGLFDTVQYEDWDYWKRAMKYTNCIYWDEPTTYYNRNSVKYYM